MELNWLLYFGAARYFIQLSPLRSYWFQSILAVFNLNQLRILHHAHRHKRRISFSDLVVWEIGEARRLQLVWFDLYHFAMWLKRTSHDDDFFILFGQHLLQSDVLLFDDTVLVLLFAIVRTQTSFTKE